MGIYKQGHCPICGDQIQVKDCLGRYVGVKPNFRQADLIWPDGHKCRSIICKKCLPNVVVKELYDIIIAPNSEASNRKTLDALKNRGEPIRIQEAKNGN